MEYKDYYKKFNSLDKQTLIQAVPNDKAEEFLYENAPRLYCPDKTIEEIFAFRTWTIRKHIKDTPVGKVLTEFLAPVSWSGIYNTINAPLFHHLNEIRWFKNASEFISYIDLFVNGQGSKYAYQTPALCAIREFCFFTGNQKYLKDNIDSLEKYFDGWEKLQATKNGLYWSNDNREATEYTISGTPSSLMQTRGLRPSFNAYMYGDAIALSQIEFEIARTEKAEYYRKKAERIKELMDEKLWDGDFYKSIHPADQNLDRQLSIADIPKECNVRELMGYVPFCYSMPSNEKCECFKYLKDEKQFKASTGFATAEIMHPRFLYPVNHSCLWNGYVWPFATSLVINAMIRVLCDYEQKVITFSDLYDAVSAYAKMQYIKDDKGVHPFIDEVMHPFEFRWTAKEIMANCTDEKTYGAKDRGKDYNHSTFIDLVLRGLIGINPLAENLSVGKEIIERWDYFKIENLTFKNNTYTIIYDKYGAVYEQGKGLKIILNQ